MEKIIEKQIDSLSLQRKSLIEALDMLDQNGMNYTIKEMTITNQISNIDIQINTLLDKLPLPEIK